MPVVKVDLEKMTTPDVWGWRFAGVDLRMRDGQLVEWYATFDELITALEDGGCHRVYEEWRNRPASERLGPEYQDAIEESWRTYDRAWRRALRRLAMRKADAEVWCLARSAPRVSIGGGVSVPVLVEKEGRHERPQVAHGCSSPTLAWVVSVRARTAGSSALAAGIPFHRRDRTGSDRSSGGRCARPHLVRAHHRSALPSARDKTASRWQAGGECIGRGGRKSRPPGTALRNQFPVTQRRATKNPKKEKPREDPEVSQCEDGDLNPDGC